MSARLAAQSSADARLGRCGRILSGDKTERAGQRVVWNANVCVKSHGKVWFGDLDLNTEADHLRALARDVGEPVFILRERDARFENEANPLYENAVETFDA